MSKQEEEKFDQLARMDFKTIKRMYDMGARLLVGTDTPNPFVVPGYSIHQELNFFVEAGISPLETLKCTTSYAAEFLDSDEFGTIEVGKSADLVLISSNPLDDLSVLRQPSHVIQRGKVYTAEELKQLLISKYEEYELSENYFKLQTIPLKHSVIYQAIYNDAIGSRMQVAVTNDQYESVVSNKSGNTLETTKVTRDEVTISTVNGSLTTQYQLTRTPKGWSFLIEYTDGYKESGVFDCQEDVYSDGLSYYFLNYDKFLSIESEVEASYYQFQIFSGIDVNEVKVKIRREESILSFDFSKNNNSGKIDVALEDDKLVSIAITQKFGTTTYSPI